MFSKNVKNGLFLAAVLLIAGAAKAADDSDSSRGSSITRYAKAKWALLAAVPAATWNYVWNGDCGDCQSAIWVDRIVRIAGLYTAGTIIYKGAPKVYSFVKSKMSAQPMKSATTA